jgi:xanthine/CO dehydrogenase XdhC/CoxF family maturation factor
MKESSTILEGFATLCREGKGGALATVIRVTGSSYRRPGARMLVAPDGRTWGGVSGGCLERDVIRRCRNLIGGDATAVARYDTSDEQEDFGVGIGVTLGCQGVIDLFLEPVTADRPGPMPFLRRATIDRKPVALATVIRSTGPLTPGTRVTFENSPVFSDDLRQLLASGAGGLRTIDAADVFFELLKPPQSLVIFGGGPDVPPVVSIARTLGWHVTVVRQAGGFAQPIEGADQLITTDRADVLAGVTIEPGAAVVVMTHNYPRDLLLLPHLLARPLSYLGILGPRRRTERLLADVHMPEAIDRVFAPIGLDLGADTPETIALAIISEIQAVLSGRPTRSLRDKGGPIYPRPDGEASPDALPYNPGACPMSA